MSCNNLKSNVENGSSAISHKKCMDILNQVLDDEVDDVIREQVYEHIKICMPCYQRYNLDKAIKKMLKTRCSNLQVPKDLEQSIRIQIQPSQHNQ